MHLTSLDSIVGAELAFPAFTADPCAVSVATDRREFDALATEWRALEASAPGALLFQSYDWCRAVWDHWLRNARAFEPRIVVARQGGNLVGILPLQIVRRGPLRVATGFAEPFQQYSDAVLATDQDEHVAVALLTAALRLEGCDSLEFLKVRDDSALAGPLKANGAVQAGREGAPYVELSPFAEFADYHATVKAKTRKNIRNSRNRLTRSHRVEHRVHTRPEEVRALVARTHQGRERWLQELGLTSRAFREPTFPSFLDGLASERNGIEVLAMSLEADGQPMADQWGMIFNGRYYAYAATWEPAYEEFSPGKLHLEDVIRACHARGISTADFLMPAVRYKLTWAETVMPVTDYALPCSWMGRIYSSFWIGALRPELKRLVMALPDAMRSRLADLIPTRRRVSAPVAARLAPPAAEPTGCGQLP
jgi:CelD/BcsL family acetyltransferase involved in cellulose biosynthesis